MRKEEIEIFSDQSNSAILRHPGRAFPGVLIQGDSLSSYVSLLNEAVAELKTGDRAEGIDLVEEVQEILESHLAHYANTLNEEGVDLPFTWPRGT